MFYLVGGAASFVAMQIAGYLVDRFGAFVLVVVGTALHLLTLDILFLDAWTVAPIFLIFALYMMSGSVRRVPMQKLATQVLAAGQRARFMSAVCRAAHFILGRCVRPLDRADRADGSLVGMDRIACRAFVVAAAVPFSCSSSSGGCESGPGLRPLSPKKLPELRVFYHE